MAHVLAKDLRDAVLQAGMMGKLTEQLDADTTPLSLLKNKKEYTDIIDDEELPQNWISTSIGNVFDVTMGQSPKGTTIENGTNGTEFHQGKIFFTDKYIGASNTITTAPTKIVKPNSVLLCVRAPIGTVNITNREICIGRGLCGITHKEISVDYIFYLFNWLKPKFEKQGTGSTFKAISKNIVNEQSFPLPPIEEQQRIVDRVDELMTKIDEYEKLENQLVQLKEQFPKDMRDSLLQAAMSGKLTCYEDGDTNIDTYIEDLVKNKEKNVKSKKWKKEFSVEHIDNSSFEYSLGNNWKWCYLGDICAIRGGKRVPVGRKLSEEPTSQKYIRVADMKNHSVISNTIKYLPDDLIEKLALYTISKNDLYITVAGTIGDVGVVPNELDGANLTENADKIIFENIDKQWLMTCLLSNVVQRQINEATTQVGQPKLAIKRIQSLSIPLCPLEEQQRIVDKLDEMLPLVDALAQMD